MVAERFAVAHPSRQSRAPSAYRAADGHAFLRPHWTASHRKRGVFDITFARTNIVLIRKPCDRGSKRVACGAGCERSHVTELKVMMKKEIGFKSTWLSDRSRNSGRELRST